MKTWCYVARWKIVTEDFVTEEEVRSSIEELEKELQNVLIVPVKICLANRS